VCGRGRVGIHPVKGGGRKMTTQKVLLLILAWVLTVPGQRALSEAFGKSLRVAVEIPAKKQMSAGVLTLAADEVKFDSDQQGADELLFSIPARDVEEVQVAGFRERFLSLKIRANADFAKAYAFLFSDNRQNGTNALTVVFELGPKEDLRAALATASEFKLRLVEAAAAATKAATSGTDRPLKVGMTPLPAPGGASEILARSPVTSAAGADRKAPTEMFRQEARYLEKLRGFAALMVNNLSGTPGELVFFDDGFGYRSERQNPRINPAKGQFLKDGYLTFRLKNDWVQNVVFKPVKGNANCVIIVVEIQKSSPFFSNSRSLLTDTGNDNEIVFLVSASSQYPVANYFRTKVKGGF
jgi:hypothetical protein